MKENFREKMRLTEKKGITLIALVLTIIILLILAGVTIATLTGDNRNIITSTRCKRFNRKSRRKRENTIRGAWKL